MEDKGKNMGKRIKYTVYDPQHGQGPQVIFNFSGFNLRMKYWEYF